MNQPLPPWPPEWPLTEFPQPNPYFPPVPRAGKMPLPLEQYGKYVLIGSAALLVLGFALAYVTGNRLLGAAVGAVAAVSFIVGYVLIRLPSDSQHWNIGMIVPAIVAREAQGGGFEDEAYERVGNLMSVGALARGGAARFPAVVEYVAGGRIYQTPIAVNFSAGSIVWVVFQGTTRTLPEVAPAPFNREAPGADVRAWLQAAMDLARRNAGVQQPQAAPPQPQAAPPQGPRQSRNMAEKPPW